MTLLEKCEGQVSYMVGILLITWGLLVLYAVFFKMRAIDFKDNGVNGSGDMETEIAFSLLRKLPWKIVKAVVLLFAIACIAVGLLLNLQ